MMEEEKTVAAGAVDTGPGLLVSTAALRWQKAVTEVLQTVDLPHVQYLLLHGVAALQGESPVSQVEVAAYCGMDVMLTSKHLRALEKKGMVLRRRHPTDTRARALEMTPRGLATLGTASRLVQSVDETLFGEGTPVDKLVKFLKQVVEWSK